MIATTAPPESPTAKTDELEWLQGIPWGPVFVLLALGLAAVLWANAGRGGGEITSRRVGPRRRGSFDLEVAKMDALPVTRVAALVDGPAHIEAVILSSVGKLGGGAGREIVYTRRAGTDARSAIGSELIVVGDETGRVGVVELELARVLGPSEELGPHRHVTLRIGDRVQVLGRFVREAHGADGTQRERVHGFFGQASAAQLKRLERPGEQAPVDEAARVPQEDAPVKDEAGRPDADAPAPAERGSGSARAPADGDAQTGAGEDTSASPTG